MPYEGSWLIKTYSPHPLSSIPALFTVDQTLLNIVRIQHFGYGVTITGWPQDLDCLDRDVWAFRNDDLLVSEFFLPRCVQLPGLYFRLRIGAPTGSLVNGWLTRFLPPRAGNRSSQEGDLSSQEEEPVAVWTAEEEGDVDET